MLKATSFPRIEVSSCLVVEEKYRAGAGTSPHLYITNLGDAALTSESTVISLAFFGANRDGGEKPLGRGVVLTKIMADQLRPGETGAVRSFFTYGFRPKDVKKVSVEVHGKSPEGTLIPGAVKNGTMSCERPKGVRGLFSKDRHCVL